MTSFLLRNFRLLLAISFFDAALIAFALNGKINSLVVVTIVMAWITTKLPNVKT